MRRLALAGLLGLGACAAPTPAGFDHAIVALERYDYPTAFQAFLPLAEAADPIAQYYIGYMYYYGYGVPEDYGKAYEWMRRSAEQGDPDAQTFLGGMFYAGEGVPQDFSQAVHWYERAAEQGDPYARYSLALMQAYGEGVPRAPDEAVRILHELAREGLPYAQRSLAFAYEYGEGVGQDLAEARAWYLKAAKQGDAYALGDLGRIYAEGIGVARDLPQAYAWWNLAVAAAVPGWSRNYAVERRDELAAQLTPARLAEAQAMATAWRPETEPKAVVERSDGGASSLTKAALGTLRPERSSGLEPESSGTGFVVSRANHVLTSHHVIDDCAELRVSRSGGAQGRATVAATDPANDLALLKLPGRAADHARFRGGEGLRQGDGLVVVGFPLHGILASGANVSTGVVSALAGMGDDTRLMQISTPVQAGNSGGPVLDMGGNVVGVVTSKLDAMEMAAAVGDLTQNVNFATAQGTTLGFLRESGLPIEVSTSGQATEVSEIVERARRFTVLVECWN